MTVALSLALVGHASAAVITVNLAGSTTGTVTSVPAGINCSNTGGGAAGPACSFNFPPLSTVQLTAVPDAPGILLNWSGNGFNSSCNSGSTNPCALAGLVPATITATFGPLPDPPALSTEPTAAVRPYSARLKGRVNPGGFDIAECRFEYGTTAAYGESVPCSPRSLGVGTSDVEVTGYPKRLQPGTTYHYRLVAENIGGISRGDDRTFTTDPVPTDSCPNAAIRAQQRVDLPFCMALEMVSPPQKANAQAIFPSMGASGDHIKFKSTAALGDTPGLAVSGGDFYVATRGESGWTTASTATPAEYGRGVQGNPQFFNDDYTRWMAFSSNETQRTVGIMTQFDGGLGLDWTLRPPVLVPISSYYTDFQGSARTIEQFEASGASEDLRHIFFEPGGVTRYAPGDPTSSLNSDEFLFVSTLEPDGTRPVVLFTRNGNGHVVGGSCEGELGGGINAFGTPQAIGTLLQGAVSPDGSRVFFTTRPSQPAAGDCDRAANRLRVMQRLETPGGVQISQLVSSECTRAAPACATTDGDDLYQAASADGTKVYFTTSRQLADSDLDTGTACRDTVGASAGCDLYLYDSTLPAGHRLVQVSAGDSTDATPGAGAKVLSSVTAVSGDGSHAYFVAQDVLTTDTNPQGETAVAGQPNLYAYQRDAEHPDGKTSFVATVAAADRGTLFGSEQPIMRSGTAAVPFVDAGSKGGDGHMLVFDSEASLTADDGDGSRRDTFRYDADADTLERVSKAVPGGSDNGPFDVDIHKTTRSVTADFVENSRWVSHDGRSVVFASPEGLVDGNANPNASVFLWRDGQVVELPGDGTSGLFATGDRQLELPVISRSGDQVAFGTFDALLPQDGDITRDVYVARVNGGFPFREPADGCESLGGNCQGPGSAPVGAARQTAGERSDGNASPGVRARFKATRLSARQRAALARGRRIRLKIRANTAGRVVVRGAAKVGRRSRRVIAARRTLTAAGTVAVPVRLAPPARRALARRGGLRVRMTVAFSKSRKRIRSTIELRRRAIGPDRRRAR